MTQIFPLPTTGRTSDLLNLQRVLVQSRGHENALLQIQEQISTGRRIHRPSQDPFSTARTIQLQRLLEFNAQYQSNITRSTSYLGESESAISTSLNLVQDVRALAISAADVTSSGGIDAIVNELRGALQQFVQLGNTNSQGRYLFSGSNTSILPYSRFNDAVVFEGNDKQIDAFVDVGALISSNISGLDVFGGESIEVKSLIDLDPVLTEQSLLASLNSGQGVQLGRIEISDGTNSSIVDLTGAESIEDVARLIESNPPFARQVDVAVTSQGLVLTLDSDSPGFLSVSEVDDGITASSLGILSNPPGTSKTVTGQDLNPALRPLTRINEILGTRATATLQSVGANNDILIQGLQVGPQLNGYSFNYVDDDLLEAAPGLTQGNEQVVFSSTAVAARGALTFSGTGNNLQLTASSAGASFNQVELAVVSGGAIGNAANVTYDSTNGVLQIAVDSSGGTQVQTVINAINAEGTFTAAYDASDPVDGGFNPTASISASDIGLVRGNTGNSGGDANTFFVHVEADATRANDVIAAFESNPTSSQLFEVSLIDADAGSGSNDGSGVIDPRQTTTSATGSGVPLDVDSGLRIQIGTHVEVVQFSDAVTIQDVVNRINQAGIPVRASINEQANSIDLVSRASGINFSIGENGGTTASQLGLRTLTADTYLSDLNHGIGVDVADGTDFTIRRNDGTTIDIDISSADTIGDVIDTINGHPQNQDPNTLVTARLALTGNGIEIVDDNPPGTATVAVIKGELGNAAVDLGLVPVGELEGYPGDGAPPTPATLDVSFPPPNSIGTEFRLTAVVPGTELNGVDVRIVSAAASGDQAIVDYDPIGKVLTIDVDPTATTASTVVQAVSLEGTFNAELTRENDPTNSGQGLVPVAGSVGITAGGSSSPNALPATANLNFAPPNDTNTAIIVTAALGGTSFNDVDVVFQDTLSGDVANASYDPIGKQLTVNIDAALTTANSIVAAITAEGTFTAQLNTNVDPTNDGTGIVGSTGVIATTSGGTPEVLTGRDVNPKESRSIFNSVTRLIEAIEGGVNHPALERAASLVEEDYQRLLGALADVSTRQRSLESFQFQLEQQSVQLQSNISEEIDTDLIEAVSNLTQQQAVYQASLQMIGRFFQTSLLDFL